MNYSATQHLAESSTFQVLHFRVGTWPYPQTLGWAGLACQEQTLQLITKIRNLRPPDEFPGVAENASLTFFPELRQKKSFLKKFSPGKIVKPEQVDQDDGREGDVRGHVESKHEGDDDERGVAGAEGHAQHGHAAQQDGHVRHEQGVHPGEVGKPADQNPACKMELPNEVAAL